MDAERQTLLSNADYLRGALQDQGWEVGDSSAQIVPLMVGVEDQALALNGYLEDNGILAVAIRPPTVEQGRALSGVAMGLGKAFADRLLKFHPDAEGSAWLGDKFPPYALQMEKLEHLFPECRLMKSK